MYTRDGWWDAISAQLQEQIDELLCSDRLVVAILLLRGDDGLQPRPDLRQAQDLLTGRRVELDRQGLLPPKSSPTTAQLLEKTDATTAPIVAIEAL